MNMFCNRHFVLSTSKLILYAIIPMLIEYSPNPILVATTSTNLEDMTTIHASEIEYPILYAKDDETLDEFIKKMVVNDIRVGIINISNPLFKEMIKQGNGAIWYSACRNGIFSYLPLIKEHTTEPTDIYCFDNDISLINKAKAMCVGSNISIYKCVAHSICSAVEYDKTHRTVKLYGGNECYLYFPPEAKKLASHLYNPKTAMSKHAQLRFSANATEFAFYTNAKMIDINALHSMVCVLAYVKGNESGFAMNAIPTMHFADLLNKNATQQFINNLHSLLFEKYLQPTATQLGENKVFHSQLAFEFVEYLFSSAEETVGRGLDCRTDSYIAKLNQHMPLLKSIENTYVTEIFDDFSKLF